MNAVIITILIPLIYFSGGHSNVVKTDYFSSVAVALFKNVIDFEVLDNYMFATNYVSASHRAFLINGMIKINEKFYFNGIYF